MIHDMFCSISFNSVIILIKFNKNYHIYTALAKNIRHLINYYLTIILAQFWFMAFIVNYLLFHELLKLMYNASNQYETIQIKEFQINKKDI